MAASPFGELWRIKGVAVFDDGYRIVLRWPAASFRLQLPDRREIVWERGDDIRLMSEVVISCRVPNGISSGDQLEASLELPTHPEARREAEEARRKRDQEVAAAAKDGLLPALVAAFSGEERPEDIPVRVGFGGGSAEFSSLLTRSLLRSNWAVEPLEPEWMLSVLVSEVEVSLTVNGVKARAELRFEPNASLARAGRLMVEHCAERQL